MTRLEWEIRRREAEDAAERWFAWSVLATLGWIIAERWGHDSWPLLVGVWGWFLVRGIRAAHANGGMPKDGL